MLLSYISYAKSQKQILNNYFQDVEKSHTYCLQKQKELPFLYVKIKHTNVLMLALKKAEKVKENSQKQFETLRGGKWYNKDRKYAGAEKIMAIVMKATWALSNFQATQHC